MYDPYAKDAPGVGDPANDIFLITPSDGDKLQRGVKAIRIWNPTAAPANVSAVSIKGTEFTIVIPAESLLIEPLRISQVKQTGTTAGLIIHGYTD